LTKRNLVYKDSDVVIHNTKSLFWTKDNIYMLL
jgi:hypothetical protein